MGKTKLYYPMPDDKREQRISVSSERLLYGENSYFFSPKFKRSSEILDAVVRGYVSKKGKLQEILSGPDLIVYFDFKTKTKEKIKKVLSEIKNEIKLSDKEVLGFFENGKYTVLLTSDCLYSNYGRDDFSGEDDPKGLYVKCRLRDTTIRGGNKIVSYDGEVYTFDCDFSQGFLGLFEELKELNKEIKTFPSSHPLSKEKREVRENYLAILVDKCLADGSLSANEVVRLEILARQIGIDSISLINMVQKSLKRYEKYKDSNEYVFDSLTKMQSISKEYYYMLYHDVITFELLSNKGEVFEQLSEFSEALAKRCGIDKDFKLSYTESIQKLVVSSYSLRDTIHKKGILLEEQEAFANLCKSVEYEYNLQKELLK